MAVKKIKAPWLRSDIVQKVVEALGADNVRFVGGAVRDTLVGLDVIDIDAATKHKPEETLRLLEGAGIKAIPTGLEHGTVTAVMDSQTVEITTLRIDVETDGRHAEVAFTEDWLEDAKRRDFTFNALYVSAGGALFDPFGGQQDLREGRVVFIGDARERIKEDGLRILRLFRFYAHFGKASIDGDALEACRELSPMLADLSVERVRTELAKLLKAVDPMPALKTMMEADIFTVLKEGQLNLSNIQTLCEREALFKTQPDPLLRLYHLFSGVFDASALAAWLKLSNKNRQFLEALERGLKVQAPADERTSREQLYHYGTEVGTAVAVSTGNDVLFNVANSWVVPVLPVQGRDLMAAGMLAGPAIGKALKQIESAWVESDFTLSKDELLAEL